MTVGHFQPVSRGGTDALDNLVYACNACNQFKHDWWDPNAELHLNRPALIEHRLEKQTIAQEKRRITELTQELDILTAEFIRMGFSLPER